MKLAKRENIAPADRHGVGETGVVNTGTKGPLRQAGLKQLHRLYDLLMEVFC